MDGLEIRMNESERNDISSFIEGEFGIKMPPVKKVMLTSRLAKRLKILGLESYSEYYRYIRSSEGMKGELFIFTDLVSTHETGFFREPQHFDYLVSSVLPELASTRESGTRHPLKVLSAACSTGEEAYTIAIMAEEYRNSLASSYLYRITGTDISTRVVQDAARGVYREARVQNVPLHLRRKYFMEGKEAKAGLVRIVPELRACTVFFPMNLMDYTYPFAEKFDIIFCRNALIYFDRTNQEKILQRLTGCLKKNGYLFIGHSETMTGYNLPVRCVEPTVYRRN
ncbi:MAG TPA: CheR family methyltransferase [Spirochaetota bacterium]|nr:CheR family methyltransferase [Spirochaetota bacterium]